MGLADKTEYTGQLSDLALHYRDIIENRKPVIADALEHLQSSGFVIEHPIIVPSRRMTFKGRIPQYRRIAVPVD